MAYAPIAHTIPEYDRTLYKNWWMKAYNQGTTTPLSMATDAAAGTLLVKCQLDAQGFPITAGGARFIPFIHGDYDLWLFPTAAEADANTTTNAIQLADNLNADPLSTSGVDWVNATVAVQVSATSFKIEGTDVTSTYHIGRRVKTTGGGDRYARITASTFSTDTTVTVEGVTDNTGTASTLPAGLDTVLNGPLANDTSSSIQFYPTLSGEAGVIDNTYPYGYAERYGAVGDGVTEDTVAITAALNSGFSVTFDSTKTYITDYNVIDTINDITIYGNGATLKRLSTSAGADFIRGAVLGFGACNNIVIKDLIIDGNRGNLIVDNPSNVSMNYGIALYGSNTVGSDTLLDNGGETKGSTNIVIENCKFYRTGSTGVGVDKFGDGVYAFGVDGLTIQDCYFKDNGRWAFACSDCFNVRFKYNIIDNATSGTYGTALGSIDIENESADQTNGSYSRNIWIDNNTFIGRCSMLVQALASVNNNTGANHYLRNVHINNNDLECSYYSTYGITGINILNTAYTTTYPDLSGIWVKNNKIQGESGTRLDTGINISGSVTSVTMSDFFIEDNKVFGFTDGIDISSSASPTLTNVTVEGNHVEAEHDSPSGNGIKVQALEMDVVQVDDNIVRDYGTYGIVLTKNGGGAASVASVSNNKVFDGLSTFTGTGIRASGDFIIATNNYISQSGGLNHDFEGDNILSNASLETKTIMTELTGLSGATATFSNVFPIGTLPLGVSTRVTTLITGATSFDIGDGTDVDRWGAAIAVAAGTTTDAKDFTIKSLTWGGAAAQSVILTANGSSFTAGAIRIVAHYIDIVPPAG